MEMKEFLSHCTACGGNWTRMLMTGLKSCFPAYWEAMENKSYSFDEVVIILQNLGVNIAGGK